MSSDEIRQGRINTDLYNKKVQDHGNTELQSMSLGVSGPSYNYADQIRTPSEAGVRQDGSVSGIKDAISGMNYYVDVIAFGNPTMMDKSNPKPLGVKYFMATGATCPNGAAMYEYIDTAPKGNMMGVKWTNSLTGMNLPPMQGLASGVIEDAASALNPVPILMAAAGTGYPDCVQMSLPVGDNNGNLFTSAGSPLAAGAVQEGNTQTRWVQKKDSFGNPVYMDMVTYMNSKKIYFPDGTPINSVERFANPVETDKTTVALISGGLILALAVYLACKRR
jgi:hypothetical protein